jgi:hypothetical protein
MYNVFDDVTSTKGKGKVNPRTGMKAQRGSRVVALLFL